MRVPLTASILVAAAATAWAVDADLRRKAQDADSFKRSDAARELAAEGSKEAAKLLVGLIGDKSPYVRDAVVESSDRLHRADAVNVLAKAASSRDVLQRRNVAAALGRTKSKVALPALHDLALDDREPAVRAAALDALWGFRGDPGAISICAKAVEDAEAFVRAAAVEAAGRVRGDGAKALVVKALDDEDEGVRCVARMELRYVDRDAASKRLHETLDAQGWRTRAQVVEDALYLRDVNALDALVRLVGDPHPRVAAGAHHALVLLTGKRIDRDAELWQAWWKQNRDGWRAPKGRLDARSGGDEEPGRTSVRYHGLEITGARVVFVIDLSGSMRDPMDGGPRGQTRWDAARTELETALAALPDATAVNVVLFQERVAAAFDAPQPLDRKTRKSIATFLKRTGPGDRGDLLAGVLHALGQRDVDTVYLLSDGAPSAGEMVRKGRVRKAIRQTNRVRKCALHTIGFGAEKASERSFLSGVASDGGGRAVQR